MCKSFFRQHVFCWAAAFFAVFLLLISGTVYADSPRVTVWPFPETLPEKYKSGDFSAFTAACDALAARLALTPEPLSKLARALALSKA